MTVLHVLRWSKTLNQMNAVPAPPAPPPVLTNVPAESALLLDKLLLKRS